MSNKRKREEESDADNGDDEGDSEKDSKIIEVRDFPPLFGRRNLGDPDIEVVVGNQLFRHHSLILCYASEYFDCMLSSGLQESLQKRVEFRDKDPEEWKVVYTFFEPRCHESEYTLNGLHTTNKFLVPWFHMFKMNRILRECDKKLAEELKNNRSSHAMSYHIEWLSFAHLYGLQKTQKTLADYIAGALSTASTTRQLETFKVSDLQNLAPLVAEMDRLWSAVQDYFTRDFSQRVEKDALLSNPLFGDLLSMMLENKRLNNRMVEETRERMSAGLGMENPPMAMESRLRRGRLLARAEEQRAERARMLWDPWSGSQDDPEDNDGDDGGNGNGGDGSDGNLQQIAPGVAVEARGANEGRAGDAGGDRVRRVMQFRQDEREQMIRRRVLDGPPPRVRSIRRFRGNPAVLAGLERHINQGRRLNPVGDLADDIINIGASSDEEEGAGGNGEPPAH